MMNDDQIAAAGQLYPKAWACNGMQHLLHHIRNLDLRTV
jgi:hypothetical protein